MPSPSPSAAAASALPSSSGPKHLAAKRISIIEDIIPEENSMEMGTDDDTMTSNKNRSENATNQFRYQKQSSSDKSVSDSVFEKSTDSIGNSDGNKRSWLFFICTKCHQPDEGVAWEPEFWSDTFPYPLCPTYRKFSRIISILLIGLLCWGILYIIAGNVAAPGGHLFDIAVLSISAYLGGWIFSLTTLPSLIGMLFTGIALQNLNLVDINDDFDDIVSWFRKIALTIILIRAGLEMDPVLFKKIKGTVLRLSLIPWLVEFAVITVTTHYALNLTWIWATLLASIIAAVSPAVVVPGLLRLRAKGYGTAKGIPTLIIAVSGIDDAVSVAIYGIISSLLFSNESLVYHILQGPISIFGGIAIGIVWGLFLKFIPEQHDPYLVPLRILILFSGAIIFIIGSERLDLGGAGPLAVITAAFTSCRYWTKQGWDIEENPASTTFEIFWMIFEPILFGITGAQIKLKQIDHKIVFKSIACLLTGVIIRIVVTVLASVGCKLNTKEKFFVSFSWMAKATVQAALGPIVYYMLSDTSKDKENGRIILMVCVLSIIVTAPIGAMLISILGPKLLTKTKASPLTETHRRYHRPSIRDITINDDNNTTTIISSNGKDLLPQTQTVLS